MPRRTKIVATIGPASDSPGMLRELIRAGMDVARLGFAHSGPEEQLARADRIRAAAEDVGRPVAVLADLPGPKVRAGAFPDGGVFLREGDTVTLAPGEGHDGSDFDRIHVDYATLVADVQEGDTIALGDGAIRMRVDEVRADHATAVVTHGGRVQGRPGVHIPSERLSIDVPTPRDLELLTIVADAGFDFAAISFVRTGDDMLAARKHLEGRTDRPPDLVAKIETRAAIEDLSRIIDASDVVMVARGDLGVECDLADVPHLQKSIIRQTVSFGKPVITATQVLETMVNAPTPTRAEAGDIANAVFDGTSALMLSAETAIGQDPVNVVRTMSHIAIRAEAHFNYLDWADRLGRLQQRAELHPDLIRTAAMTHAAWLAARESDATALICCTRSGLTARVVARFRPTGKVLGLTPDPSTARRLALCWGAKPYLMGDESTTEALVDKAVALARDKGEVQPGDTVAVLTGRPGGTGIDALRLLRVPEA